MDSFDFTQEKIFILFLFFIVSGSFSFFFFLVLFLVLIFLGLESQWVGVTRQSHSIYAARLRLGLPRRPTHRPTLSPRNDRWLFVFFRIQYPF